MDKQKELWPGGGLWLDLRNVQAADIEAVKAHIEKVRDLRARILWLERLIIEFNDIWGDNHASLAFRSQAAADFIGAVERMKKKQTEICSIRIAEMRMEKARRRPDAIPSPTGERAGDPEPAGDEVGDPSPGKWTNRQVALALHALLDAAEMPMGISDSQVGKFAALLTGRPEDSMRQAHAKVAGGAFDPKVSKPVADAFERIGLHEIANSIRQRFKEDEESDF